MITPVELDTYQQVFESIKQRVHESRHIIYRNANRELINLYYWIGQQIVENQARHQ